MPFHILSGILANNFANNGTLTFDYPAGTTRTDYTTRGHKFVVNQIEYSSENSKISVSLGVSTVALTNTTGKTFLAGVPWQLQLAAVPEIAVTDSISGAETAYATLALARTAAVSADLVRLGPGAYTASANIGKNGVSWQIEGNLTISGTTDTGLFDDQVGGTNGTLVCNVDAMDVGSTATGDAGSGDVAVLTVFTVSQPNSVVVARVRDITTTGETGYGCLTGIAGSLNVQARNITAPDFCLYWENGDMVVKCNKLTTTSVTAVDEGVASIGMTTLDAAQTGKLWVDVDSILSTGQGVETFGFGVQVSAAPTAQIWINNKETSAAAEAIALLGSKLYYTSQKLATTGTGTSPTTSRVFHAVYATAGIGWVDVQKIGGPILDQDGGELHLVAMDWQDNLGGTDYAVRVSGGTCDFQCTNMTATTGTGALLSGGVTRIHNSRIDTSIDSSLVPLSGTSSASVFLKNVHLEAGHATATLTWDGAAGPTNNDTVTIGSTVYTFKTTLTPAAGEVLLNGGGDASLLNLIRAINHTGTPGTDYGNSGSTAVPHTTAKAKSVVASHAIKVSAIADGVAGESIASTETSSNLSWSSATLLRATSPCVVSTSGTFTVNCLGGVSMNTAPGANVTMVGAYKVRGIDVNPPASKTLAALATTFEVTSGFMIMTGDSGGNTVATITGGAAGMELVLFFIDALITITDTAAATTDTVNLSAAFTSTANDVLTLIHNGTKWFEKARSVN